MTLQELEQRFEELKTKVDRLEQKERPLQREQLVISVWTKIVDTQMHFNDMVMRVRNLAITLILAVFGAAAYSAQSPIFLNVYGRHVHIALFIIIFGLAGWLALWIMDLGHFHKLLRGAVEKGIQLEQKYKDDPLLGHVLGMTTQITEHSRKLLNYRVTAGKKLGVFYGVVFIAGIAYCYAALNYIHKEDFDAKNREQIIKLTSDSASGIVLRIEQPQLPATKSQPTSKHKKSDSKQ